MPKVNFVSSDGSTQTVEVESGTSVLEAAHRNNVDLEGACEGSLACSTCHVVVDEAWFDKLPEATEDEEDMLDLAFGLTRTSRLGCQIVVDEALDGLVLRLPTESRDSRG
ncbi:MAG: ferredoxin family 2Fe-2S iron-sulfur cluster binding protein [Rhodospirillaceae bacterium]